MPSLVHRLENLTLLQCQHCSNWPMIQHNLYQNPSWLLCRNWQVNPKIHMEWKGLRIAKTSFIRRRKLMDSYFLFSKLIKTVWYWYKDGHINQWNRMKSPGINPNTLQSFDFWQGYQNNSMGVKNSLFNKWCWDCWIATCESMRLNPYLIP